MAKQKTASIDNKLNTTGQHTLNWGLDNDKNDEDPITVLETLKAFIKGFRKEIFPIIKKCVDSSVVSKVPLREYEQIISFREELSICLDWVEEASAWHTKENANCYQDKLNLCRNLYRDLCKFNWSTCLG